MSQNIWWKARKTVCLGFCISHSSMQLRSWQVKNRSWNCWWAELDVRSTCSGSLVRTFMENHTLQTLKNKITYRRLNHEDFRMTIKWDFSSFSIGPHASKFALFISSPYKRKEGKGRRCCLGEVLECHTRHLSARMIWRKLWKNIHFARVVCLVCCEQDDHPSFWSIQFCHVSVLLLILFFKSSWY